MKDWLIYQKLVAQIYAELDPNAVVTHDDEIIGMETGKLRQIDVSIRASVGNLSVLIIVQVKDYKLPADVNVVGEFISVIRDVRANKGVIVCSGGFSQGAIGYAKREGITLCKVSDAASKKWKLDSTFPLLWVETDIELQCSLTSSPNGSASDEDLVFDRDMLMWPIISADDNAETTLKEKLKRMYRQGEISQESDVWHEVKLNNPREKIRLGSDRNWCEFVANIKYRLKRRAWLGQFNFTQLRAITDYNENTVTMRAHLSRSDLPLSRSAKWEAIKDPDEYASRKPFVLVMENEFLGDGTNWTSKGMSIRLTSP